MWLSVLAYERGGDFVGLSPHPSLRILRGGLFMYTGIGVLMVDFIDVTHTRQLGIFFLAGNNRQGRNTLVRSKMDYVAPSPNVSI